MFVRSELLRSPHAFSTRRGGESTLPHTSSLNLAFGRGDDDATVLKNLEKFARSVGFDPKSVVSLPQIHSDVILEVGAKDRGRGYYTKETADCCDGYVTDEEGVVIGIKTADCVPILFEAEKNGVVAAVGATHAGWRGTAAMIAPKCVEMLCKRYGVSPRDIKAAIGPSIGKCCYEVGKDLYDAVSEKLGRETAERFIIPIQDREGKYSCDLAGINEQLLISAGVLPQNVDVLPYCTCCRSDLFYSHRASGGVRGTMLSVIFVQY